MEIPRMSLRKIMGWVEPTLGNYESTSALVRNLSDIWKCSEKPNRRDRTGLFTALIVLGPSQPVDCLSETMMRHIVQNYCTMTITSIAAFDAEITTALDWTDSMKVYNTGEWSNHLIFSVLLILVCMCRTNPYCVVFSRRPLFTSLMFSNALDKIFSRGGLVCAPGHEDRKQIGGWNKWGH